MKTGKKRFAKIKADASIIFWKRVCVEYNNRMIPKPAREFKEKLKELANKTMEITKEYNDRIQLKYPPELVKPYAKGKIVGIDLQTDLVDIIETK